MHQISCSSIQSSTLCCSSGKKRKGASEVLMSCFEPISRYENAVWVLHCRIETPALTQLIRRECMDSEDADLESTWNAGWDSVVPPWILPLNRYNGSTLPHAHGLSYPLLTPDIPKGWAHLCRTQKKVLQTLQMGSCLQPHFPSLV